MFISISSKGIASKPSNVGAFINSTSFKNVEINGAQFQTLCENGYTFKPVLKDVSKKSYFENIAGTQLIVVDVDACTLTAEELIAMMAIKPTAYQTSFSHKTEKKGYKNCYHFYFVLTDMITEHQYIDAYAKCIKGVEMYADAKASNIARMFYTSNKSLPNFEFKWVGKMIDSKMLCGDGSLFCDLPETDNLMITKVTGNIEDVAQTKIAKASTPYYKSTRKESFNNSFGLSDKFFNDFMNMGRAEFLAMYDNDCRYYTESPIPTDKWVMSSNDFKMYADLRDFKFYQVPTAKYVWDKESGNGRIIKVGKGNRNLMMFLDAIAFDKIIENITKEELVYCLYREVHEHFEHSLDYEVSRQAVVAKAMQIWDKRGSFNVKETKKTIKLNMKYYRAQGINDPLEACRIAKRHLYSTEIGEVYDCSLTIEENIKVLHDAGLKTKKATLIKWCEENGVEYTTTKSSKDSAIIALINANPNASSREIEKMAKENGVKVSYRTIARMMKKMQVLDEILEADEVEAIAEEMAIEDTADVKDFNTSEGHTGKELTQVDATKVVKELLDKSFAISNEEIVEYLNEVHKFYGYEEHDIEEIRGAIWDEIDNANLEPKHRGVTTIVESIVCEFLDCNPNATLDDVNAYLAQAGELITEEELSRMRNL